MVHPALHRLNPTSSHRFFRTWPRTVPLAGLLLHFSTVPVWLNHPAWIMKNISEGPMVEPQESNPVMDQAETKQYQGMYQRQTQGGQWKPCPRPSAVGPIAIPTGPASSTVTTTPGGTLYLGLPDISFDHVAGRAVRYRTHHLPAWLEKHSGG